MRPAGRVKRQGGITAYVPDTIHRFGKPTGPVVVSILEVAVRCIIVTDMGMPSGIQRQGSVLAHVPDAVHRFGEPTCPFGVGIPEVAV